MRTVFYGIIVHHELTCLATRKTRKIRTHCHKSFINFNSKVLTKLINTFGQTPFGLIMKETTNHEVLYSL